MMPRGPRASSAASSSSVPGKLAHPATHPSSFPTPAPEISVQITFLGKPSRPACPGPVCLAQCPCFCLRAHPSRVHRGGWCRSPSPAESQTLWARKPHMPHALITSMCTSGSLRTSCVTPAWLPLRLRVLPGLIKYRLLQEAFLDSYPRERQEFCHSDTVPRFESLWLDMFYLHLCSCLLSTAVIHS